MDLTLRDVSQGKLDSVKVKFKTEKYRAMKNNTELGLKARWLSYVKFILEIET